MKALSLPAYLFCGAMFMWGGVGLVIGLWNFGVMAFDYLGTIVDLTPIRVVVMIIVTLIGMVIGGCVHWCRTNLG